MGTGQKSSLKLQRDDTYQFRLRLTIAYTFVLLMFTVLAGRFFFLQVIEHKRFVTLSNNRISLVPIQPTRGQIIDRNGIILAQNYSAFTLEITPSKTNGVDKTIAGLSELITISDRDLKRFKRFREDARSFEPVPLKLKLTEEEAAIIAANAWRFPGVTVNARLFRDYPYKDLTSHVLGYIGRINAKDVERLEENDQTSAYRGATHMGKTGLEYEYEEQLRGSNGYEEVETNAGGRAVRTLRYKPPVNGDTLHLSLDIRLQEVVDKLFGNRRGALVAIDPQTGEVLAFVSKPSFDANLFIDGIDHDTWNDLNTDWRRPLVNRALRGLYPPGSTFKPFMALAALQSKTLGYNDIRPAPPTFSLPGDSHKFRDASRAGHGAVNLQKAITVSSDTFFYRLAWEMGIDKIHPLLAEFGLGSKTGIDLDGEAQGVLPSKEWKAKRFANSKKSNAGRWLPGDVVSIGIGQGYNTYTPLQMAHATAILANGGIVYKPHLVREIIDSGSGKRTPVLASEPVRKALFKQADIDYVKKGMIGVLKPGGTAWRIGAGLTYSMGGKTGTAQVVQIRQGATYNAAALAEQHRDHSWFIAFAPAESPKIAIAVIVENAGWGASAAGPLARSVSDFYLTGKVPPELKGKLQTVKSESLTPTEINRASAERAAERQDL